MYQIIQQNKMQQQEQTGQFYKQLETASNSANDPSTNTNSSTTSEHINRKHLKQLSNKNFISNYECNNHLFTDQNHHNHQLYHKNNLSKLFFLNECWETSEFTYQIK